MKRGIKVKAVWRREPDIRLYVLALIELARQLQAEERATDQASAVVSDQEEAGDD
jgi:hypothetical protein